jgi:hypothetical protein
MSGRLQAIHLVPALAPADITTTTTYTDVMGLKEAHEIEIDVLFGAITGDAVTLTVEECDDTTPSNSSAIAFNYQMSSAMGTDNLGAVTAATTSGITVAASDDNKVVRVFVDPSVLSSGYPYVRVKLDPGASMTACVVGAVALLRDRYPQEVPVSAVD